MAQLVEIKGDGAKGVLVAIKKALVSRDVLGVISIFIRDRIYQNTKRGFYAGVQKNLSKFRPLSPDYIEYRKQLLSGRVAIARDVLKITGRRTKGKDARRRVRAAALAKFGPFFSPAKSNLTMTGQMLEALSAEIIDGKIKVFIDSSTRSDGQTNAEVAKKVIDAGRPFLRLDDKGIDRIRIAIIRNLRRLLKNR